MKISNRKFHQIKINLAGGIVSVGDLSMIMEILKNAGLKNIRFGGRQQLYFCAKPQQLNEIKNGFQGSKIDLEVDTDLHPNIVSSYVAEDLFNNSNWLREGIYKDILDSINYKPSLKINLVDDSQTLIPFFSGNLNYISSDIGNYWHLYLRFPKTNTIHYWSSLINSQDIAPLSELIEKQLFNQKDLYYDQHEINGKQFENRIRTLSDFMFQNPGSPLMLPVFQVPYYEGFNKYNQSYWLGIYQRNELFSIDLLRDLCAVCSQTRIGQIYTTPWKSIIIKGVAPTDRRLWNMVLDKNRINVRHASNELNWQTEDLCEESLQLKHELIRKFNDSDIRTFKLCFAIKINPKSGLFGSIIIKKQNQSTSKNSPALFDLFYTEEFNPNAVQYHNYEKNIPRANICSSVIQLCEYYYQQQTLRAGKPEHNNLSMTQNSEQKKVYVYQCPHCLSLYDESWGDPGRGIAQGALFKNLPEDYTCMLCETVKTDFIRIPKNNVQAI